jgi:hypothetical protein
MINETFKKTIRKAESNGWDFFCWKDEGIYMGWDVSGDKETNIKLNIIVKQQDVLVKIPFSLNDVVFNFDFAIAFFGQKIIEPSKFKGFQPSWKAHLQRIVLEKEKIKYLANLL